MDFPQPYDYPESLTVEQGLGTSDNTNPDSRAFRILDLLPGTYDDDICVELRRSHLIDKEDPTFEALSYVWGAVDDPVTIYIGREKVYILKVTRNLATALRHLRCTDQSRTLWIDALCIDQFNTAERSSQVRIMADIYRLATKAVVWLGPVEDDSDEAMSLLIHLSSEVPHPDRFGQSTAISDSNQTWAELLDQFPDVDRGLEALGRLINRDWFERLWIRQEIFFTSDVASVQCGHKQMSWKSFRNAIWLLRHSSQDQDVYRRWYKAHEERFRLLLRIFYTTPVSLRWLRDNFRGTKCSDQRDRIYATLSLLFPEEQRLGIVPDYSLSPLEIYKDAMARYIQSVQQLSILRDVVPSPASQQPGWPSWVPDWSVTVDSKTPDHVLLASGPLKGYVTYQGNSTIRAAGVRIGVVERVWSLSDQKYPNAPVSRFIRESVPRDSGEQPYPAGGSLLEAYTYTLTEGDIEESFYGPVSWHFASMDMVKTLIESIHSMNDEELERRRPEDEEKGALHVIGHVLKHRAVFRTEDGYIGVGPKHTVPGDHVCAFLGCEIPIILRALPDSGQYRIVGGSFVHGYASGEAFLGRLPDHFRFVTFNPNWSPTVLPGYLNMRRWIVQTADPRASSLPIDALSYSARCFGLRLAGIDLSPDTLKGLGVDIKYFDIV